MENHNNMDGDAHKFVRHGTPMNQGWPYPRHQFNHYSHYPHMYSESVPHQLQPIGTVQPIQAQEAPQVHHVQAQHVPQAQVSFAQIQVHTAMVQPTMQIPDPTVTTHGQQMPALVTTATAAQSTLHDALTNRLNQNMNKANATSSPQMSAQTSSIHHLNKSLPQEPPPTQILTRARMQDLVREVDPNEQLDDDVEEILLQMADDFVESAITNACLLAKHRKASTVEVKDLQLHLERNWNMWIPGFGTDELRPYKRSSVNDAHKQRLTLIRKATKKY